MQAGRSTVVACRACSPGRPRNGRIPTVEGNVSNAVRLDLRGAQYPVLAARVTG